MKHETQNNKNKFGFSVIEVMAAITIIVIGLVGVLSLVMQNIQVSSINKNELIASQLAQEGLELVRNVRDTNWLTPGYDWARGDQPNSSAGDIVGNYAIDYLGNVVNITDVNDPYANLKISSDGLYWHGATGVPSIFNRHIFVTDPLLGGGNVPVVCTVMWKERGNKYYYTASTVLYDWR